MHFIETGHKFPLNRRTTGVRSIANAESRPIGETNGPILKVRCRQKMTGRSPQIIKVIEARRLFQPQSLKCSECQHRPQCATG